MKFFKISALKDYSVFFWIILISILGILVFSIYTKNKQEQTNRLFGSLDNIYLKKTIQEITKNLDPRFTRIAYVSKSGDTYESIIDKLSIDKNDKKLILITIIKEKSLKVLIHFKFDNLSNQKIIKFTIETDKKNEVILKNEFGNKFVVKKIKKNFKKISL